MNSERKIVILKILVLVENYSIPQGKKSMHYVHTRNLYYCQKGYDVEVISFQAKENYIYEGIRVFSKKHLRNINFSEYVVILSHAPNLKHHVPVLFSLKNNKNVILYFHGHEVMDTRKHYPKPYKKISKGLSRKIHQSISAIYDRLKILCWKILVKRIFINFSFVFVSDWMLKIFKEDLKLSDNDIKQDVYVIANAVGEKFIDYWNTREEKEKTYDVVTIRTNMDSPKYGIDLVVQLAESNPELTFEVFSHTRYFDYYSKPQNLIYHSVNLNHDEIIKIAEKSKLVYLPTRLDAQGVMACEIATLGVPLLVSDIPIMREMLEEFPNVRYLKNDFDTFDLKKLDITNSNYKVLKFGFSNTIQKELEIFQLFNDIDQK